MVAKKKAKKKTASKKTISKKTTTKKTIDLFAPAKTSTKKSKLDVFESDTPESIDSLAEQLAEMKALEGRLKILKAEVFEEASAIQTKLLSEGNAQNFKLQGIESIVSFVSMNMSSGLTSDDIDQVKEASGENELIDDLVEVNYASMKVTDEFVDLREEISRVLADHFSLEVARRLFTTPTLKVRNNVLKQIADEGLGVDTIETILEGLKVRRFIKG